ncbi:hydrolase [Microtetraspora sp. NBRC 13810]|nr:hydrolase [Microtetraspora sp. NBRC 13810]
MTHCPADVQRLLADATHVLFDFDGPICSIFAGLPAPTVAAALRDYIGPLGIDLPGHIMSESDPLEILRHAASAGPMVAETVEAGLRGLELQAALRAAPTPHADAAIHQLHTSGRRLAVVSNNSDAAIKVYIDHRDLSGYFAAISARTLFQDPALLKPHVHLIIEAIKRLDAAPSRCVLIGDSVTDIQAAIKAGVPGIGYANTPAKEYSLAEAGAHAVINDMAQLIP